MAAMIGILRNIGLKSRILSNQPLKLLPMIRLRLLSDEKSGSQNIASGKTSTQDDSTSYNVPEYYSHDKDTYANMEVELTQAGYRQSQPDPRVPYYHHYPWEKKTA